MLDLQREILEIFVEAQSAGRREPSVFLRPTKERAKQWFSPDARAARRVYRRNRKAWLTKHIRMLRRARKYRASAKGKATIAAYYASERGQAVIRAYRMSDRGRELDRARGKKYRQTEGGKQKAKERQRRYRKRKREAAT